MADTSIEWTDKVWNPVRGCSRVSEGCRNCYAERQAARFSGPGQPYEGLVHIVNGHPAWTGVVDCVPAKLDAPLRWRKPARIFVNSMSDLFHESVQDEFIDRVFAVMAHCSAIWHRCTARECDHSFCDEGHLRKVEPQTFQILTKRPGRMLEYLSSPQLRERVIEAWDSLGWYFENPPVAAGIWPLPNVWLGVSVEDQKTADERIPLLTQTPAAVRWVSAEPLLGACNLREHLLTQAGQVCRRELSGVGLPSLDWVVCGGESGPRARPMHPDWARSLRDQCQAAGVPFFFKQWGEWGPAGGEKTPAQVTAVDLAKKFPETRKHAWPNGTYSAFMGKHTAGSLLDGVAHKAFPMQTSAGGAE